MNRLLLSCPLHLVLVVLWPAEGWINNRYLLLHQGIGCQQVTSILCYSSQYFVAKPCSFMKRRVYSIFLKHLNCSQNKNFFITILTFCSNFLLWRYYLNTHSEASTHSWKHSLVPNVQVHMRLPTDCAISARKAATASMFWVSMRMTRTPCITVSNALSRFSMSKLRVS